MGDRTVTKKPPPPISPYRLHKGSGQGYVVLDGRRIYLGRYELPSTRERYGRVVAEWEANGRHRQLEPDDITVVEVATRYLKHGFIVQLPSRRSMNTGRDGEIEAVHARFEVANDAFLHLHEG